MTLNGMRRCAGGVILGVVIAALSAGHAHARPPRQATVIEGVGMAGVRIGTRAPLDREARPQRVTSGVMRAWGPVGLDGFCFEGSSCSWAVPGGGRVTVEIGVLDDRVSQTMTTSRAWRTRRGVRVGMSVGTVRDRYRGERRERRLEFGPYGVVIDALVLQTTNRTTAFEIRGSRVVAIWVFATRP